jgi:DNA replication regulator DPB11
VPHNSPLSMCPEMTKGHATIVNEWWIERCIHYKSLVDPEANVTSRPFPCFPLAGKHQNFPVKKYSKLKTAGFERMTICSTAFGDVDLLHVSKLVGLMGMLTSYCARVNESESNV